MVIYKTNHSICTLLCQLETKFQTQNKTLLLLNKEKKQGVLSAISDSVNNI